MISIVLYGRNDNYGYNLHKRAALSLNCMAEVLTDDNDEILFVDYNTPDDFPTFPEAIVDTLTAQALKKLRVLRVRPDVHDAHFGARTHLKALEPVSRNVAVRRSNPENRWILSTNTDMIFVPRQGLSLTDAVRDLPKGFYCAPRFEIPETLWESFNRMDPAGVIAQTRECGEVLHLNEVVLGAESILYDAPGDFQLFEREDMFRFQAFDEEMLLGWHVDSNISKRFCCEYDTVGDALPFVLGYHCDHTRQVTPMHRHKSKQNDLKRFVDDIDRPDLLHQKDSWGLARVDIEEISMATPVSSAYRAVLAKVLETRQTEPHISRYRTETFDQEQADPDHILPFLLDIFAPARRDTAVAWVGPQDRLFALFSKALAEMGMTTPILPITPENVTGPECAAVDVFVIHFGAPDLIEGETLSDVMQVFWDIVTEEMSRNKAHAKMRRLIMVNAIHNRFETLVSDHVVVSKTPFSTRLRQGFIDPGAFENEMDWSDGMQAGSDAAILPGDVIQSSSGGGCMAYGPYRTLQPGAYTLRIQMRCDAKSLPISDAPDGLDPRVEVEIVFQENIHQTVRIDVPRAWGEITIPLQVDVMKSVQQIHLRIMNFGCDIEMGKVTVTRGQDQETIAASLAAPSAPRSVAEMLPFLRDTLRGLSVQTKLIWAGPRGPIYDSVAGLLSEFGFAHPLRILPDDGQDQVGSDAWEIAILHCESATSGADLAAETSAAFWRVAGNPSAAGRQILALNGCEDTLSNLYAGVVVPNEMPFSTRLRFGQVRPDLHAEMWDWTADMRIGEVGETTPNGAMRSTEPFGCVVFGPYAHLPAGLYTAHLLMQAELADTPRKGAPHAVVELVCGDTMLARQEFRAPFAATEFAVPFTLAPNQTLEPLEARVFGSGTMLEVQKVHVTPGHAKVATVQKPAVKPPEVSQKSDVVPAKQPKPFGFKVKREIKRLFR